MPQPVLESTWAIVKYWALTKYRAWTIIVVLTALGFFLVPTAAIAILALYIGGLYMLAGRLFMQEFARNNGLTYMPSADVSSVSGRLFREGNSRSLWNVLSGSFGSQPMRLFNFTYSVGSGKSRRTYRFTVCEIAFEKTQFPHM